MTAVQEWQRYHLDAPAALLRLRDGLRDHSLQRKRDLFPRRIDEPSEVAAAGGAEEATPAAEDAEDIDAFKPNLRRRDGANDPAIVEEQGVASGVADHSRSIDGTGDPSRVVVADVVVEPVHVSKQVRGSRHDEIGE